MVFELILLPLLAGIAIAVIMGPVGCFVIWRRMAYFGDTLAHGALIGVALSLLLNIPPSLGTLLVCLILALFLFGLKQKFPLPTDTLLGILSHSALAVGIVTINLTQAPVNLMGFLFGDILAVQGRDILWISITGCLTLIVIYWFWKPLVMTSLSPELAKVEGVNVERINILLMILMAVVTAIGIRIVGVLLTTALLVIPAATARQFAESPEKMAVISILMAIISVLIGIGASFAIDVPVGPMIVLGSASLFFLARLSPKPH